MLRWTIYIVVGLVGLVGLVAAIGLLLPKRHRASKTMTYAAPPATVFAAVSDVAHYADWRTDVTKVDVLPDDGRGVLFREHGKNGEILFRVERREPPTQMLVRIADPNLAFGGTWTYALTPHGAGTELTITEDGEVYNPIFRFMSTFFFSPSATIDAFQNALAVKVGR